MRVCPLLGALFCMAFSPIFYIDVYLPCVECEGFKATVAHEAGHVLGFHHPDALPWLNLRANRSLPHDASTCMEPFAHVHSHALAPGMNWRPPPSTPPALPSPQSPVPQSPSPPVSDPVPSIDGRSMVDRWSIDGRWALL